MPLVLLNVTWSLATLISLFREGFRSLIARDSFKSEILIYNRYENDNRRLDGRKWGTVRVKFDKLQLYEFVVDQKMNFKLFLARCKLDL